MKKCFAEDCGRGAETRGLCGKHYMRWYKYGDPNKTFRKMKRKNYIKDGIGYLELSCGGYAQCSIEDFDRARNHGWYQRKDGYVAATIKGEKMLLHWFICGRWHDHKNRNRLDNRRCNLRKCSTAQNSINKPSRSKCGYKGVYKRANGKFRSSINFNKESQFIGNFDNIIEAAKAYDRAAIKFYGDFAWLNFPIPPKP